MNLIESVLILTCCVPFPLTEVTSSCIVSTLCQSFDEAAKAPPRVPQGEISVNMNVLARRKAMDWQQGKVMEIITKGKEKKKKETETLHGEQAARISGTMKLITDTLKQL